MIELRRDLLNPTLAKKMAIFHIDKDYVIGNGSYLTDSAGTRYLDFIAQYGAVPFGYNPDFLWDTLDEVRKKSIPSLVQPSIPGEALKLANTLASCSPGELCFCTFCQSGTEAVEAAIKMARSTTGREIIVSTSNSFHGKTLGSLSATGKNSYHVKVIKEAKDSTLSRLVKLVNEAQTQKSPTQRFTDKFEKYFV
ncbi:MAG: aminotransferase class III-fold pyridoxal phosphate-dependent enzyme, partial [Syntrophomonadaceae bacterium]|nr:aminotransferase class III-fold pyridoxal phosphate-dependent enzyme [Syntrophomonadaceae bacterium]